MRSLTRYQVIISVIFIKTSASIYLCDVGVFVSISALIPSRVIKGQLNPAMNQMQLWAKFFTTSQYSFSQTLSLIHLLALSLARNVSFFSTFCLDHNTMWVAAWVIHKYVTFMLECGLVVLLSLIFVPHSVVHSKNQSQVSESHSENWDFITSASR